MVSAQFLTSPQFWPRGLVGAQAAPLRGVQVAGLEVGLAAGERGGHATQVRERRHVARAVEELRHAHAAADPVAGRQRVNRRWDRMSGRMAEAIFISFLRE